MPERIASAHAKRFVVRSAVEHVLAGQKHRMGLIVRTTGIARARIKPDFNSSGGTDCEQEV